MDSHPEILRNRPNPLIESVQKEVERRLERPAVPQEPTVIEGLQRALRRHIVEHGQDTRGIKSDEFIEVSSFTPWKRYGPPLRKAIDQYGVVFLHTETDEHDRPTLLAIGTMSAKIIVCHLTEGKSGDNWNGFAEAFPQLAATLDHGQLVKVTSTFAATKRLLDSESTKYVHEIVDLEWFFGDVVPEVDLGIGPQPLKIMKMVWAVLGSQQGPVTREQWKHAYGQSQAYPEDRDVSKFTVSRSRTVGTNLPLVQRKYLRQIVRSGCILTGKFVIKAGRSDQLRQHVIYLAKNSIGIFTDLSSKFVPPPAQFSSSAESPQTESTSGPSPKRVTFSEPIAETKVIETHASDFDDDTLDATPGSPMDEDPEPTPGPSRPMTREEKVANNPFYDSESDEEEVERASWSETERRERSPSPPPVRAAIAEPRLSHQLPPQRQGPKRQRRRGERSIPYPEGFDLKTEQHKRSSVNRDRAEYRVRHPEEFVDEFLGGNCCRFCGETPKHKDAAECAVHYYRMMGRLPQQCTIPCLYCESLHHTTDACEFLHSRCSRCSFRGHMKFECRRRRPVEWLIAYLDCCHLGKLTRENQDGPLRGRWGFGDVTGLDLPRDVWELVRFKERSMKRFRTKTLYGHPGFNPIRETSLHWNLIVQRNMELQRREREVQRERNRVEELLARFRAEQSHHRHGRKRMATTASQTDDSDVPSPSKRSRHSRY